MVLLPAAPEPASRTRPLRGAEATRAAAALDRDRVGRIRAHKRPARRARHSSALGEEAGTARLRTASSWSAYRR